MLRNSHIRLLFTGSFFAVAFVAMAIVSYGVDVEEIKVFLIFSFMFVAGIMIVGFLFSFLLRVYRKLFPPGVGGGLLEKIEKNQLNNIDEEFAKDQKD
ncbi:MAG: hypothetical protein JKY88_14945 [Pseudomonadales bacterium]|nr:hypothetical protein [Pseudomonadales bacterium]